MPGETLGRYRLMKKIARGGMAEVFAARSFGAHGFEKTVAIKRILPRYGDDPQFVRMMVDEAKITVLLNHPNVATILELCEQDGDYFIVMEFVPGQSLSGLGKKLREKGERLGVLESCFIVVELLQGLHAAHVQKEQSGRSAHIIHRDVSPQNVLVSFDGHVKVIDFGIARAKHRLEMTEVGTIKGKLRYLAPEMIDPGRFMKSGDFDHRVDVFAAGIVLWELIAHRTLYQGDDEMVVYDAITDSDAPDLGKMGMCDPALAKIVAKALVREPDKRYLSAEEFADDLRAYVYRTDPAFTHKRIASAMERLFPAEKEEMLALERGGGPHASGPHARAPAENTPASAAPTPVNPIAANAETRTQHTSAPEAGAGAASKPTIATQATKQMRTGESSKKLNEPRNNKVVPIDDDVGGPAQGDVLTVMTLVSKVSRERRDADAREESAKKRDFRAGSETITVSDDPKATRKPRVALDGPPAEVTASVMGNDASGLSSAPGVDDTPHTSERSRATATGHKRARRAVRPRLLLLAGASGIGVALIAVVAMELSAPSEPEKPVVATLPPTVVKEPVRLTVTSPTPGARVLFAGEERAVPATFSVLPGDSVEVVVKAEGHVEKSERVLVPRADAKDQVLDVSLDPNLVPLTVEVTPKFATVDVGEAPYAPGMQVRPGRPVMVQVSAPGYVTVRKEIAIEPGKPARVAIELKRDGEAGSSTPPVERKTEKPDRVEKKAVAQKLAKLVVKTKPVWGYVTIDGRTFDQETPLTVDLKPGTYNVVVTHPPKGWKKSFKVTLKSGEIETKTITFE